MTIEQKLNKEIEGVLSRNAAKGSKNRPPQSVTYAKLFDDKMLLIELINAGIPYSLFDLIQSVSPFTEGDWAAILDLSPKSLQRYKQAAKVFKPSQSEKIVEMAEVMELGENVFGDTEGFKAWLNVESVALGGVRPIDLLQSSYGKDLVKRELINIEHGIFA